MKYTSGFFALVFIILTIVAGVAWDCGFHGSSVASAVLALFAIALAFSAAAIARDEQHAREGKEISDGQT